MGFLFKGSPFWTLNAGNRCENLRALHSQGGGALNLGFPTLVIGTKVGVQ